MNHSGKTEPHKVANAKRTLMDIPSTQYQPIDCEKYDYVEIACLHRYQLEVDLTDGSRFTGTAITTKTIKNDGEYLVIETAEKTRSIRLDTISSLSPLDQNAKFTKAYLTGSE